MAKTKKFHIVRWWNNALIRKKYKDKLFRKIFENKQDLLSLYNAVNHTDYTDLTALEITTIDNAIYMSMKNDLSFMIGFVMNLYEHQSTFNPNMPVRGLSYFARLYEAYITRYKLDIYGKKQILLPLPQYIVFYNGRQNQPDELELKLSDAFVPPVKEGAQPALECRVRMFNINLGHNQELMQNCRRLWEYARFVAEVNQNLDSGCSMERAVNTAIDTCIQQDILKDILQKSRSEVLLMFLTEYDEKLHMEHTFEEGRVAGLEQGHKTGLEQGKQQIILLSQHLLNENRMEDLKKAYTDEQYLEKLLNEFHLEKPDTH